MQQFIYFSFTFSPLFNMRIQECNWIFKETGLPFAVEGALAFLQSLRRRKDPLLLWYGPWPSALQTRLPPRAPRGQARPEGAGAGLGKLRSRRDRPGGP